MTAGYRCLTAKSHQPSEAIFASAGCFVEPSEVVGWFLGCQRDIVTGYQQVTLKCPQNGVELPEFLKWQYLLGPVGFYIENIDLKVKVKILIGV